MTAKTAADSTATLTEPARHLAELTVRLHRLIRSGQGSSPAADELRDEMDVVGAEVGRDEMQLLQRLSGDLYEIGRHEPVPPPPSTEPRVSQEIAWNSPAHLLEMLRQRDCRVPQQLRMHLRGSVWDVLGVRDAAIAFNAEALRLAPDSALFRYERLMDLHQLGLGGDGLGKQESDEIRGCLENAVRDRNGSPAVCVAAAFAAVSECVGRMMAVRRIPEGTSQLLENCMTLLVRAAESQWPDTVENRRAREFVLDACGLLHLATETSRLLSEGAWPAGLQNMLASSTGRDERRRRNIEFASPGTSAA